MTVSNSSPTDSINQTLSEMLQTQLKTYPATTVTILSSGSTSIDIPAGKFKSVKQIDVKKQQIVISRLEQSDLLIVNLLLEKMGYDFFLNVLSKVRPQFICCSFYAGGQSNVSEKGLVSRLLEKSYELFKQNEISLPNGKTLLQLDFIISSTASIDTKPVQSSYKSNGKDLVSLSAFNVGFQKCEPLYRWGPAALDHYVLYYVTEGAGTFETLGNKTRLSKGDCFLCFPNAEVSFYADKKDPWEYAWVGFAGTDAAIILNSTDFTPDTPVIKKVPNGDEVLEKIRAIYKERGNGFSNTLRMTGLLYELLSFLIDNSQRETIFSTAQVYVQGAVKFISENYAQPITIENIADYVGICRSQLFRCFESVLGISPKEYLIDFRIKQACHLLETTSLSITAIANSLGFDNSLYFSKAFHKLKGMSPSEYKNCWRSGSKATVGSSVAR